MRKFLTGLASAYALAACTTTAPTKTVAFADGAVIATTPSGYCVDGVSSKLGQGFAVMAPCTTLGESADTPEVIGVATVQVGPPQSGAVTDGEIALRDFLITDTGTSLLSVDGNGDDVTILSTQAFNSQVMVHFTDKGEPPLPGLQREEWRAFTDIDGRLVTIAVRGLATAPLQDGPGAGLLKLILAGVKAAASAAPETALEDDRVA
ncbi:MAG: dihydroxy-acid dehydratase [Pseudomonadota bacterium]